MFKSISLKIRSASFLLELIVAALLILWIYTAISKIFDYHNFKIQLGLSPFIAQFAGIISILLPTGELIMAILLVFEKTRKVGLYLSFAVMLLFTGYIYIMLHFAYDLPCSCGGVLAKMSWDQHLYFNIIFTGLALIGILAIEKK